MTETDRRDRREELSGGRRDGRRDPNRTVRRADGGRPRVAVVACGGTIASEPSDGGAAPEKTGDDLVAAVPAVSDYARVTTREVCSQPGFDVRWRDVLATAAAARDAVHGTDGEPADGVVVTHGTDTLADTAFALDLLTDLDAPVVVTGAQRRLDEPASDVPANLALAVRAAADDRFAPGVHVAFDDELHTARDVAKGHSNALSTMTSPGAGPVATFTRAASRLVRTPERGVPVDPLADAIESPADVPEVPVIHSGTGVGSGALERALDAGVGGVVVEGTGLGNVTGALGDALGEAVESVPVVVAGRPPAGPTEPVYGTPGGAVTLADHGVTFAGDLPAPKARVALSLGLAAGLDREGIEALFDPA
ncbi:asparaginase/glutaminase [Halorubrum californiense DSM 19288]|uniref:Asparaginase/glutaminase n=1 Tax=Halorubrum californiense DSM 19288 TaxID=1227465 RepID=M0EHR3_9EURY|nr:MULTISPECIES: asparaginase [Halorubrum]ELZ46432.1 asparaginase/glutaminase [Halorubrum californiense DSM 19288]TKX70491.1 asparaginase [Halorubrum sp. GN11GM_10-3_MGM]